MTGVVQLISRRGGVLYRHTVSEPVRSQDEMVLLAITAAILSGVRLRGLVASNQNMKNAIFTKGDLRNADFRGCDLRGVNLRGALLRGASFYGASLRRADLRGADLRYANLSHCTLDGADLRGARLQGARVSAQTTFDGVVILHHGIQMRVMPEDRTAKQVEKVAMHGGEPVDCRASGPAGGTLSS